MHSESSSQAPAELPRGAHRMAARPGLEQGKAADKVPCLVEARRRLRSSPYAALHALTCSFHEGVLVLHGRVASYYLKQLAQATVVRIAGVEEVSNRLEVVAEHSQAR